MLPGKAEGSPVSKVRAMAVAVAGGYGRISLQAIDSFLFPIHLHREIPQKTA
jgi:hypothetical protein